MNKELISTRFSKTRDSYHKDAVIQKEIAEHLFNLFLKTGNSFFTGKKRIDKILEIGSGSGFLTRCICDYFSQHPQKQELILNDIAGSPDLLKDYLAKNNIDYDFIKSDAESYDFGSDFDYIFSSSVIQWFKHPEEFIIKCSAMLKDKGLLVLSTFLPDNMREIKQTLNIGLDYPDADTLKKMLEKDFEILFYQSEIKSLYFDTPIDVLRHMKKTGVNGITNFVWTNTKLNNFTGLYKEKFKNNDRVSLTYNPVYIIARKK